MVIALGVFSATCRRRDAAPSGKRNPCSQLRTVPRLTFIASANKACDRPRARPLGRAGITNISRLLSLSAVLLWARIRPVAVLRADPAVLAVDGVLHFPHPRHSPA